MAIGMLFLGGGRASFRRDPVAIACLVLATSPRYPNRTIDHQYHMQALRHLYVLAVEWRLLRIVDVDSGEMISLTVDIVKSTGEVIRETTPCLLSELADIREIRLPRSTSSSDTWYSLCGHYIASTLNFEDSRECITLPVIYAKKVADIIDEAHEEVVSRSCHLQSIDTRKISAAFLIDIFTTPNSTATYFPNSNLFPVRSNGTIIDLLANNSLSVCAPKARKPIDQLISEELILSLFEF
jgi:hypothetical protein